MNSKKFANRPNTVPRIVFLLVLVGVIVGYFLIAPGADHREVPEGEASKSESGDFAANTRVSSTGQEGSSNDLSADSSSVADDDSISGTSQSEESVSASGNAAAVEDASVPLLDRDAQTILGLSETTVEAVEDDEPYTGLIQSEARPLGLDIIGPVEADPQDEAYMDFMENGLEAVMEYLDGVYKERADIDSNTENLDLSVLVLEQDSDVRVYFLKEGTIFRNTLGINMGGDQRIIFPNASSAHSYFRDADTRNDYTSQDIPLLPGDYVEIGQMPAGSLIDLFLIKDGARDENGEVFWGDAERNEDQINHVKLIAIYDENTYIIGFEDIPGGGDRDYNDLVIAVEIKTVR